MKREQTLERRPDGANQGQQRARDGEKDYAPPWHTLEADAVADELSTDVEVGLTAREARQRLERWGPNRLEASKGRSALAIFVAQFKSLIVVLLLAATAVALSMGEHLEAVAILVVVVINALIGFLTELNAAKALSALQRQTVPEAQVVRDGKEQKVDAASLVPGDTVVLAAGARVPADGRVIESVQLRIDEASLTGESDAVDKDAPVLADLDTPLADRVNMAFMGTTAISLRF